MNRAAVQAIEGEFLYRGFDVYPYRRRAGGRRRWTFGPLFPRSYAHTHSSELCCQQIQCLVEGDASTRVEFRVGFLHLTDVQPGRLQRPAFALFREPAFDPVESLTVRGLRYRRRREAVEREVALPATSLEDLTRRGATRRFDYPASRELEGLRERAGDVVGVLVHSRERLTGAVHARAVRIADGLYRVTALVENLSPGDPDGWSLDAASRRALASAHTVLGVKGGQLVSLIDPPHEYASAAAACVNRGCFPVLVGDPARRDTLLASPMILHDFPQS